MTEQAGPGVTIALRDGSVLRIAPNGLHIADRFVELGRLQDARQVAPDPLTIAVRASGERQLIEFQPQQPQDGDVALETIYRLRPDLRPAGFVSPVAIPGSWPPPPPPPMPFGVPPYAPNGPYGPLPYPPPPGSYPPPGYGPYGPPPPMYGYPPRPQDTSGGRFTPFPRDFGGILGAVFNLFGAHWRVLITLALLVTLVPGVLAGLAQVCFYLALGVDPWSGSPATTATLSSGGSTTVAPFPFSDGIVQPVYLWVAGGLALLTVLLRPLEITVLGIAARDAVFGRQVSAGRSLAVGLRRFFPVLGTSLVTTLIGLVIFLPSIALLVAALVSLPNALDGSSDAGSTTAALLGCTGFLLLIPSVIFGIFVSIKLAVAPYITATEDLGPFKSIAKSWALTRGQWWHTFLPLLVVGILSSLITVPASFVQYISYAGAVVIAVPLVSALVAPLGVLAAVIILYDLRLRQEGYQTVAQQEAEPQPASTIHG